MSKEHVATAARSKKVANSLQVADPNSNAE